MTNLQMRALIAAIYFPVMLWSAFQIRYFALLICLIAAFCWYELLRFNREWNGLRDVVRDCSAIFVGCLPPLVYSMNYPLSFGYVFALLVLQIYVIYAICEEKSYEQMMDIIGRYMLGFVYLTIPLTVLIQIRSFDGVVRGEVMIWFLLFVVAAGDTAAYFVGRKWGRRPFFERISPKKTMEGFAGGLAGSVLVGILFSLFFGGLEGGYEVPPAPLAAVLAFFVGLSASFGDLFESLIKRHYGVKDSGRAMGGHGGFLDRFDSLIFAGVPLFFYLVLRGGFR
jgi:phosphatidate cytidylyltransferase